MILPQVLERREHTVPSVDLLRQVSSRFIQTTLDDFEASVVWALEATCDSVGMSRAALCFLAEFHGVPPVIATRWTAAETQEDPGELSPAVLNDLRRGEPVVVDQIRCMLPLVRQTRLMAVLVLEAPEDSPGFSTRLVNQLRALPILFSCALSRHVAQVEVEEMTRQVQDLKAQMETANARLRQRYQRQVETHDIVAESPGMKNALRLVDTVAPTDSVVLIQGETGTGKEILARRIHALSSRSGRPMIKVNCAALSPSLIESELFGREKGAYTGALTRQAGRFEVADRSTLFLDEVGELPFDLQAKLLRVLQEGRFERLGSTETLQVDVRVIAATNRDLVAAVEAGDFRRDLFYRLSAFPITIPPLRERPEDIPPLARWFLEQIGEGTGRSVDRIAEATMGRFMAHPWPGNVRELRNVIERGLILSDGPELEVDPIGESASSRDVERTLDDVQREHILGIMSRTRWRIRGPGGAAALLGLKPTTLESRMARLGVHRASVPCHV